MSIEITAVNATFEKEGVVVRVTYNHEGELARPDTKKRTRFANDAARHAFKLVLGYLEKPDAEVNSLGYSTDTHTTTDTIFVGTSEASSEALEAR